MKSSSIAEVNSAKLKFIGLFVTSVVLCVAIAAAFWGPLPGFMSQKTDINILDESANANGSLSNQQTIAASLPADSASATRQGNAALMSDAEKSLTASIDSLKTGPSAGNAVQVSSTLALFREAVKNPNSMSLISDVLRKKGKTEAGSGEDILKLKDDILIKEGQIVSLQKELKAAQGQAAVQPDVSQLRKDITAREAQITTLQNQLKVRPVERETGKDQQNVSKLKEEIQMKEAQITKLMNQLKTRPNSGNAGNLMAENKKLTDENNFLKWAVRSEVSSNHNLTNLNSSLKQSNAALQNQINELKKK